MRAVARLDSDGVAVVKYRYDAWGKPISKTGDLANTLGTVQPFRYRAYAFDEETELYYLRSRYYNPDHCRFVNADVLYHQNLMAYAANNPVYYCDKDGYALCRAFEGCGFGNPFASLTGGVTIGGGSCSGFAAGLEAYSHGGVMQGGGPSDGGRGKAFADAMARYDSLVLAAIDSVCTVTNGVISIFAQASVWLIRHSVVPLLSIAYAKAASYAIQFASYIPVIGTPLVGLLLLIGYGAVISLGDVAQRGLNSLLFGDAFEVPTEEELINVVKNNIVTDMIGGVLGKISDGVSFMWGVITTFVDVVWSEMPSAE